MRYRTECSLQVIFRIFLSEYPNGVYFNHVQNALTTAYAILFHIVSRYVIQCRFMVTYGGLCIFAYLASIPMFPYAT